MEDKPWIMRRHGLYLGFDFCFSTISAPILSRIFLAMAVPSIFMAGIAADAGCRREASQSRWWVDEGEVDEDKKGEGAEDATGCSAGEEEKSLRLELLQADDTGAGGIARFVATLGLVPLDCGAGTSGIIRRVDLFLTRGVATALS